MNTLDSLMMKHRTKLQTPSVKLATILNDPVVAIEKAASAVMIDANFFMLVDAAGHAVWAMA